MEMEMVNENWQNIFQEKVLRVFKELLEHLNIQIDTNVFLLEIPVSGKNVNEILFHPEKCGFTSSQLQNVFLRTEENFNALYNIIPIEPDLQNAYQKLLCQRALKKSVENILEEINISLVSFCSHPVKVDKHWVMTIIQLNKADFDSFYKLKKDTYDQLKKDIHEMNELHKYKINRSFLEAVIVTALSESYDILMIPTIVRDYSFSSTERILEDAASRLLLSIRQHVNDGGRDLFELSNIISAQRYEGAGSQGKLVICSQENSNVSVKVKFKKAIKVTDYRGIRKLLEVSSDTMALLCDGACIWGLGTPTKTYDPLHEDIFEIRFTGHYTWELFHAENVMLTVKYRKPNLPQEKFNKEQFHDHINSLFKVDDLSKNRLLEAVEAAVNQSHGTMLIISAEAEKESKRLSGQSTAIEVIPISKDIVSHISSVDGAIIVSPNGNIYSFGVILDGLATENGDPSRGARFNSAVRYIDRQRKRNVDCLAIIVSEDGYVDFYPTPAKHKALKCDFWLLLLSLCDK
jgi:DNA integrity scanning protein DisA with diadenylate cyclase activity